MTSGAGADSSLTGHSVSATHLYSVSETLVQVEPYGSSAVGCGQLPFTEPEQTGPSTQ